VVAPLFWYIPIAKLTISFLIKIIMIENIQLDQSSKTFDPNTLNEIRKASFEIDVDELNDASEEQLREIGLEILQEIQDQT